MSNANFVISKIYEAGNHLFKNISYLEVENNSEEAIYINEHLLIAQGERRMLIAPDGFATDFEMHITQKTIKPLDTIKLIILYKKVKTQEEVNKEKQGSQCKI